MKKYTRILSMILALIMIIGVVPASASDGKHLSDIKDFEELRKVLKSGGVAPFESRDDAYIYREIFYKDIFPEVSANGHDFSYQIVLDGGFWIYGNAGLIPKAGDKNHPEGNWQKKDLNGNVLYLGFTQDGRQVPNIKYNESKMSSPVLVESQPYIDDDGKAYTGNVRPFKTDYTNPEEVGQMFAPNEDRATQQAYGKRIIGEWAKKTKLRETGWNPKGEKAGANFSNFFTVDEYMKYVTITIPPTSKTEGQAVVWFKNGASETRRTFIIEKFEPLDYIAKGYKWDEASKTLSVKYEIVGIDVGHGVIDHLLETTGVREESNIENYKHEDTVVDSIIYSKHEGDAGVKPGEWAMGWREASEYPDHFGFADVRETLSPNHVITDMSKLTRTYEIKYDM